MSPLVERLLREAILRKQAPDQGGGFRDFRDGRWVPDATGTIHLTIDPTPDELASLCEEVGVVPTEIVPLGSCKTCRHSSKSGHSRGWSVPCVYCIHPRKSHWEPKETK